MTDLVPRQVASRIPRGLLGWGRPDVTTLAAWLTSDEGLSDPSVRRWIHFLADHYAQFRRIHAGFPRENPGRQGMKDQCGVATNPEEMLVIVNHLFILRSHGIEGCVLECGCFKGHSSCCLSIACRRLGYPLVIADSFAGLPSDPAEVGEGRYYQPGDFAGRRPEVEKNLRTLGDPAAVELVEGWFSDTLKGWNRPLALIWLDVDLWSSVLDVLEPCLPHLDHRSVLFSHEFWANYVRDGRIVQDQVAEEHGPAAALDHLMQEVEPDYRAAYATGNLGVVGRPTSIGLESYRLLNQLIPSLGRIGTPSALTPAPVPRAHLSRFLGKFAKAVRASGSRT
jgi:hypothetical protein